MKALTYTIIAGSRACENDCPICISKMTPDYGIGYKEPEVDWEKFEKATTIALNHGAENVLITGKGEPTLFPYQITKYLHKIEDRQFDRRELQTDGCNIASGGKLYNEFLRVWKDLGLDVIAVSVYHYNDRKNKEMFRSKNEKHYDLETFIEKIHSGGLNARLSCVMLENYIDSVEEVQNLIDFAKENDIFQLTLRTADRPKEPVDSFISRKTAEYVDKHKLGDEKLREISDFLEKEGTKCDVLPHGAVVYEVDEQNVCLTTGLTYDSGKEEIRQLIFFPQGWLTTSWENVKGGRIL